jgi:hypothetical protein
MISYGRDECKLEQDAFSPADDAYEAHNVMFERVNEMREDVFFDTTSFLAVGTYINDIGLIKNASSSMDLLFKNFLVHFKKYITEDYSSFDDLANTRMNATVNFVRQNLKKALEHYKKIEKK